MRIKNIILVLLPLFLLSGCYIGSPSYEVFERNMKANIGNSNIPLTHKNKKVYSEDRYIYISKRGQCEYGFLTNRDDKPEVVIDWILLSDKEYCKQQQKWIFSF